MWEQEGGEIMLVAPLCVCVHCTRVSGYAARRKQTAAKIPLPPHTHTETATHKTDSGRQERQRHTYVCTHKNPSELVPNAPLCSQMSCTHIHPAHFPYTPNTHSPTHMKNKHSLEIHPHMKTTVHSLNLTFCIGLKYRNALLQPHLSSLVETHLYMRHFLWGKRG